MKLVRFRHKDRFRSGILKSNGQIVFRQGSGKINFDKKDVELLSPVIPSKIILVGLNYRDHAEELGMPLPSEPVIFFKPTTAITGPGGNITCPGCSNRVDFEAELAVVIKEKCRRVSAEKADKFITGYTCFNDVTARDLQNGDPQWARSKSFDTFGPTGPWIETDVDPGDLRIRSFLNDEIRQDSRTSQFVFSVPELVEYISRVMTLLPGDLIATGTPSGIGPMKPGDRIDIEIEGIGRLSNMVVKEK